MEATSLTLALRQPHPHSTAGHAAVPPGLLGARRPRSPAVSSEHGSPWGQFLGRGGGPKECISLCLSRTASGTACPAIITLESDWLPVAVSAGLVTLCPGEWGLTSELTAHRGVVAIAHEEWLPKAAEAQLTWSWPPRALSKDVPCRCWAGGGPYTQPCSGARCGHQLSTARTPPGARANLPGPQHACASPSHLHMP